MRQQNSLPPYGAIKNRMATILLSLGVLPRKFQKTRLGYWLHIVPNIIPIGEVLAEKTVTEQTNKPINKQTNKQTVNLVFLPYNLWRDNKSPQSNSGRATLPPSQQRLYSPTVCSICAMPLQTRPLSHRYTTSTPQCHILHLYLTLYCPIHPPAKFAPSCWGIPTGKNHPLAHLAHTTHHQKRHNWRTSTELLLL